MSKKRILIIGGVGLGIILLGIVAIVAMRGDFSQQPVITPVGDASDASEGLGGGGEVLPTPSSEQTQIATPSQTWDCVTINSPDWSTYNPNLPVVRNAFRGILIAGDPVVWEPGPFKHIDNAGVERLVDTRPELSLVFNGEQVCVQTQQP